MSLNIRRFLTTHVHESSAQKLMLKICRLRSYFSYMELQSVVLMTDHCNICVTCWISAPILVMFAGCVGRLATRVNYVILVSGLECDIYCSLLNDVISVLWMCMFVSSYFP